ncbi:hypothetical protein BRADI_1g00345v3 [Brachypodium distachyon]|uniref:Uncharacterized protein n=1 Tax=Brachypodium distachyon TaxID=15368 RepID=A0A2K2DHF7_BRADI|nr:hypothetical protein BRADI_1g00345v3 [Brachypodium distachyon]
MQSRVQPYGQTCGLKRSREKSNDYCDIEFVSREDAQDAIQNCTIDKIDFKWAPEDIYKKKAKGPAIASFQSPGFDYDIYSQEVTQLHKDIFFGEMAICNGEYSSISVEGML